MGSSEPSSLITFGRPMRQAHWLFEPFNTNLNHGSFGAFPRPVRDALRHYQDLMEANPDAFLRYDLPRLVDISRAAIASYVHVPLNELVIIPNATTGVNTVLRNLKYEQGDRILYFSTLYGACEKTLEHLVEMYPGLDSVRVELRYPLSDDALIAQFRAAVEGEKGGRVKVAVFDTVTSLPGVRMPFERLVEECRNCGVLSLVDGAHGIGHLPLDLGRLDADFFVSNCHKYVFTRSCLFNIVSSVPSGWGLIPILLTRWLYVPRGCAILHVPTRNQPLIRSSFPTSHGFAPVLRPGRIPVANPLPPSSKPRFVETFEFVGSIDYSPYLCIPAALKFRAEVCGGEKKIMEYCSTIAYRGAQRVAKILGTEVMNNKEDMMTWQSCMVNVRLPLKLDEDIGEEHKRMVVAHISKELVNEYRGFIATVFHNGVWWARVCGQIYLEMKDFEYGGRCLLEVCDKIKQDLTWRT
jgi:selenocysteine lyase/cysteine desulfurase